MSYVLTQAKVNEKVNDTIENKEPKFNIEAEKRAILEDLDLI